MNGTQHDWIKMVAEAAADAQHCWPTMAACEAALESGYGTSALAKEGLNLFGMKAHASTSMADEFSLPTREFLAGTWVSTTAEWMKYATLADCFKDRMATLTRLAPQFPHYADALASTDPMSYVTNVSESWSTDPERAAKVIAIYGAYNTYQPPPAVLDASDN